MLLPLLACVSAEGADSGAGEGRTVAGVVLDGGRAPIVDLQVTATAMWCIPDTTDVTGAFAIRQVTETQVRLLTYGETPADGPVASLSLDLAPYLQGTDGDVRLPELVTPRFFESYPLDPDADAEAWIRTADGLELTLLPGSLVLPPLAEPVLRVARADPAALPPFGPDEGVVLDAFVLDPFRATIDPPAPVRFPPQAALAPGDPVALWALDDELGRLVRVADGVVDDEGRPATAEGTGLPALTWIVLTTAS